jgi:acyl-CoA synthetase (AMP-forming)/AMP-acid ligase II
VNDSAPARVLAAEFDRPDAPYLRFLPTGELHTEQVLTRGELARRARRLAEVLIARGHRGARALLVFPPGLEFPIGFFGSMLAGAIAVPAYTPDPSRMDRSLRRLRAIIADSGATVVITTTDVEAGARDLLAHAPDLAALDWIVVDELDRFDVPSVALSLPESGDLAFLQYTSGSTGDPRGVEITHANIVHNVEQVWRSAGRPERVSVVGWVPVHHDMGLVSTVLWQLWHGGETTLLSPVHFVQRPMRWLQAIERWKANYSPAPTFGYDLLARKATDAEVASLDLSTWHQAVVSAEPVRWSSLEAFARRFAPAGFRIEQFNPCFGLAESTVIVTGSDARGPFATRVLDPVALEAGRVVDQPGGRVLVGSGKGLDADVVVVDPASGRVLPDERIGEIWVSSRSIGRGYWMRPDQSAARFGARLAEDPARGPFLRTATSGSSIAVSST